MEKEVNLVSWNERKPKLDIRDQTKTMRRWEGDNAEQK